VDGRPRRRARRRGHRPAALAARGALRRADRERDRAGAAARAGAGLAADPRRGGRGRRRRRSARHAGDQPRLPRTRPSPVAGGGVSSLAIAPHDVFRVPSTPEGDAAALQGLTLSVAEGEILTVLGPSGAGKTSFLRILAGLDVPSAGTVRVFGQNL